MALPVGSPGLILAVPKQGFKFLQLTASSRRERKRKSRRARSNGYDMNLPQRTGEHHEPPSNDSGERNRSDVGGDSGFSSTISESTGFDEQPCTMNPYSSESGRSFMARSRYFEDTVVINEDQARSHPIGDAGGPTEDDIQLLRLQGAFELPPRSIKDGLINTFMEKCSPWMPIIERGWLEGSGAKNPPMLLLQSIFVAASRVTSAPAVLAYASPHQFYRRAKALFWSGYEKNPVTVVAAVCILHWYNPEHVSTNTSGFWRYVGVRLAHQIGLHKEPTTRRDAPLRRRLWWTLFVRLIWEPLGIEYCN
ncbi:hypothetical protein N7468_004686 [Penicillium chermesinum]|uniref:Xylanolytic transcriptional activator regulatory domain-containing protein n=1 Tax=Penicillium chermesinum TaxID=63820 RepID=A0A9W9TSZ8_9EURO|nr:uncharacterized protein N7468_004686 [Penicillium chermesinum]KAJ5240067.1 hypothetical protein N7468_004686 [Penicillium chermesinum]